LTLFGVVMVTGNLGTISAWFSRIFVSVPFLNDLATV
jgi:hypothetical protein